MRGCSWARYVMAHLAASARRSIRWDSHEVATRQQQQEGRADHTATVSSRVGAASDEHLVVPLGHHEPASEPEREGDEPDEEDKTAGHFGGGQERARF